VLCGSATGLTSRQRLFDSHIAAVPRSKYNGTSDDPTGTMNFRSADAATLESDESSDDEHQRQEGEQN
jgi:hypothetical protein